MRRHHPQQSKSRIRALSQRSTTGWPAHLMASAFNRLRQYTSSPGPKFTNNLRTILRHCRT